VALSALLSGFLLFWRWDLPEPSRYLPHRYAMTVTVKTGADLVVPPSVQRRAGIKTGDRLSFKVTAHAIVITPIERPSYKPSKSELAAIRNGEAEIARGEYVTLSEILNDLDRPRRKGGAKTTRKPSR
jgi:predicted transcriptional regulator